MASLETVLTSRLPEEAASWFRQALHKVRVKGEATDAFLIMWSGAGRRLGQARVGAPANEDEMRLTFFPEGWGADELGRVQLLQAALSARLPEAHAPLVNELYVTGDLRERQAVLHALPLLPAPERFVTVAVEAVRNPALSVLEAIACENAFPARHFSEEAFNQLVLKCLFSEVPLRRVTGLARRVTPELRRMVEAYASERRAAGSPPCRPTRPRSCSGDDLVFFGKELRDASFRSPHPHATSRTTDDYQAMAAAGVVAIVEPAFWLGQPRSHVGSFEDYFLSLVGWGARSLRAQQFGIRHYCTLALNPKEANNPKVADGVLALLPRYLEKDAVVAVGEIGYDDQTPAEDKYFAAQLELARAHKLPVMVHTPHRDKLRGTERSLALLRELQFPPELVLIDHNNEVTLPIVLDAGCWAGHSIYPATKMDEPRMVSLVQQFGAERILVNSAADWGVSDALKVPKTVAAMRAAGVPDADIQTIFWDNPVRFFAQSGRLDLAAADGALAVDQRRLYEGNSVLRGQTPRVD